MPVQNRHRLVTALCSVGRRLAVVRRFARNVNVMWMSLLDGSRTDRDEPGTCPQFVDSLGPTIPHTGPQAADQLEDKRRERSLKGNPAFDSFRHQLACLAILGFLPVT